jgi:DNA repair protein RadC
MSKASDSSDLLLVREVVASFRGPKRVFSDSRIASSLCVARFFRTKLRLHLEPTEFFYLLLLNAKNEVTGYHLLSKGGSSSCGVTVADMFRPVIVTGSPAFVAVHNHPSGDPTPSADDVALTDRIVKSADILGVKMLDHIVIGDPRYFSFLDSGLLTRKDNA